jgi:hypothetical protein
MAIFNFFWGYERSLCSEITKKMVVLEKRQGYVLKEFKEEQWE